MSSKKFNARKTGKSNTGNTKNPTAGGKGNWPLGVERYLQSVVGTERFSEAQQFSPPTPRYIS